MSKLRALLILSSIAANPVAMYSWVRLLLHPEQERDTDQTRSRPTAFHRKIAMAALNVLWISAVAASFVFIVIYGASEHLTRRLDNGTLTLLSKFSEAFYFLLYILMAISLSVFQWSDSGNSSSFMQRVIQRSSAKQHIARKIARYILVHCLIVVIVLICISLYAFSQYYGGERSQMKRHPKLEIERAFLTAHAFLIFTLFIPGFFAHYSVIENYVNENCKIDHIEFQPESNTLEIRKVFEDLTEFRRCFRWLFFYGLSIKLNFTVVTINNLRECNKYSCLTSSEYDILEWLANFISEFVLFSVCAFPILMTRNLEMKVDGFKESLIQALKIQKHCHFQRLSAAEMPCMDGSTEEMTRIIKIVRHLKEKTEFIPAIYPRKLVRILKEEYGFTISLLLILMTWYIVTE